MQKITNNSLINDCELCYHSFWNGDRLECQNVPMIEIGGRFPEVNPDKIHESCPLKDVEVVDDKVKLQEFADWHGTVLDDIEKILIIRKGEK